MNLQKYFYIFKSTWQEFMAYRANFFMEILGGAALFGAILFLWVSVYKNSPEGVISGYTFREMITYLIGTGLISSSILLISQGDQIDQDINRGFLSNYLLKPVNVNFFWLVRDIARKVLTTIMVMAAFSVIIVLGGKYLLMPASLAILLLVFLAVMLGSLMHFIFFYLASVIAFWLGRTWGVRFVIRITMEIATGAIIPLSFLPGIWKNIFEFLPFKFIAYFPMQIYLGKIAMPEVLFGLTEEFFWLVILAVFGWYLWQKGVKHYTASGA